MFFSKGLRGAFILFVAATAVTLLLILAGLFAPKPLGAFVGERPLSTLMIPGGTHRIEWLAELLPPAPYSLRLTAAYGEGEMDVGYGLALGVPADHLVVAVSPLGYVSVWRHVEGETAVILPWQPWPHVRPGQGANEIWLDVDEGGEGRENGRLTIRINREQLWSGEIRPLSGGIGLAGESFGETFTIDFQTLALWASFNSDNK